MIKLLCKTKLSRENETQGTIFSFSLFSHIIRVFVHTMLYYDTGLETLVCVGILLLADSDRSVFPVQGETT